MRDKIFGTIGIVWGGAIVASLFFRDVPSGTGAYNAGRVVGFLFGAAMFAAGVYYVFFKPSR